MDQFLLLKLNNGMTLEARADCAVSYEVGAKCLFSKDFYQDVAEIIRQLETPSKPGNPTELPEVRHLATDEELAQFEASRAKDRPALRTAQEWVDRLALPMKLINAHNSCDGKLVTIQFCADGRVDFRELVKELSRALSCRIELRQIGVRDETSMYGGIGVCGQTLCCCRFLHEFSSINVKMAKEQDLALTPSSISGVCGRLKCCLKFEYEGYRELEKNMPRKGDFCETPAGNGKVCDRNLLTGRVSILLESGNISTFKRDEIKVLPRRNPNRSAGNDARNAGKSGAERRTPDVDEDKKS